MLTTIANVIGGRMKFKFKLDKVLNHRKNLEDVAQRDFQEAQANLNFEIQKLSQMQEAVRMARLEAFKFQSDGGKSSSHLNQVHDYMVGQDLRMERQKEKIKENENLVENLREILRAKAIDCKIITELKRSKSDKSYFSSALPGRAGSLGPFPGLNPYVT